ncbi:hypothetical protein BASA61_001193 [Batrachochytrium salamandrivorans]|nr:hypothetical protein BASA61_001193 [Batrachochytrium salamandrivorans]
MKLAAAAILSLVATAAYASPVAYSENQVSAQYSAADAPVTVHLEKRTGKQLGFMERIAKIKESSGLKKEYTDPVYGRKVGFNPVVDLVRYDDFEQSDDEQSEDEQFEGEQSEDESIDANGRQSDDEDSSQSQGSTEESTGTTGGQPDNETPPQPQVSTQESVDSNGEQSNDEDPFKAQEVLTQESTGTTGEQSNNEASSQSKVSIKDRRFDFQKLMNRFNGGGSTDTSSEQSNNEDPPQSKVPAKDRRFDFHGLGIGLMVVDLQILVANSLIMKTLPRAKYPPRTGALISRNL